MKFQDKKAIDLSQNVLKLIKENVKKIATSFAIGFTLIGGVGYFIRLVFISINKSPSTN